jgi:hypothetical protein
MMKMPFFKKIAVGMGVVAFLYVGSAHLAVFWMVHRLKTVWPLEYRSIWPAWPFLGVRFGQLKVRDPSGEEEFLVKVPKAVIRLPWIGWWIRPTPMAIHLERPHFKITADAVALLFESFRIEAPEDLEGLSMGPDALDSLKGFLAPIPVLPYRVAIRGMTMEAIAYDLRPDEPVFIVRNGDTFVGLVMVGCKPVIRIRSRGDFVTKEGRKIGFHEIEGEADPKELNLHLRLRLRHEQLGDFQNLYRDFPRPVLIKGGLADLHMEIDVTQGRFLDFSAGCMVQNLDLDGLVEGGVPWSQVMQAIEDDQRRYAWELKVRHRLDDPSFDLHDYVLSYVEWDAKERAAAKGLKLPGQLFFYKDTPTLDVEEEAVEVP